METENSQNVFSVSITHNSKIRELSYGNRVIVWPNNLFTMGPTIFELWVMETENWVVETPCPNRLLSFVSKVKYFKEKIYILCYLIKIHALFSTFKILNVTHFIFPFTFVIFLLVCLIFIVLVITWCYQSQPDNFVWAWGHCLINWVLT